MVRGVSAQCGQGVNPRHFHGFQDEDGMAWLKGLLDRKISVLEASRGSTNEIKLVGAPPTGDVCKYLFSCKLKRSNSTS